MSELEPEDVDMVGGDEYPADASVKIRGPPGMGKTTQGMRRVYELVENGEYDVGDVTWATYRTSLADDALARLNDWDLIEADSLIEPWNGETRWWGTIHAIANRSTNSERFRNREPAEWRDKQDFMKKEYSLYQSTQNPQAPDYGETMFSVFNWCINNEVSLSEAYRAPSYSDLQEAWSTHPPVQDVAESWREYKNDENLYDFHELLQSAGHPPTDVVVIDEMHDCYPLMFSVVKEWIEHAEVAIVLGDPQQVVNVHEGASPEFFESLDLPEVELKKTWRVPPVMWDVATDVLDGYHTPPQPESFERTGEGAVEEVHSPLMDWNKTTNEWMVPTSEYGSPDWLVEQHEGEDLMMLTRTRRQLEGIAAAFEREGIPYATQNNNGWGERDERRNVHDALQRIRGVRVDTVNWNTKEISWADHAEDVGVDTDTEPPSRIPEDQLAALIRHTPAKYLDNSRSSSDELAAHYEADESGWEHLKRVDSFVSEEFWTAMTRGSISASELVQREGERKLDVDVIRRALNRLDEPLSDGADSDQDWTDEWPTIRTIHASKGSEADVVCVYDGVPSKVRRAVRNDPEVASNEDRLWYVALTRARNKTVIVRDAFRWTDRWIGAVQTGVSAGDSTEVMHSDD